MHAAPLRQHAAAALAQVLTFKQAADAVLAAYGREHRALGPRERLTVADTVYAVLRAWPRMEQLVMAHPQWASVVPAQRKATAAHHAVLLAWHLLGESFAPLLAQVQTDDETPWVQACLPWLQAPSAASFADLSTRVGAPWPLPKPPGPSQGVAVATNAPAWLAGRLAECWPDDAPAAWDAMHGIAPLDARVNPLKAKPAQVLAALADAGLAADPLPHTPGGLRMQGKPSLTKTVPYEKGWLEVQDEGSQRLAQWVAPKRNELVVDFCAGAGGKTLAMGAAMRNTGRLYALDTSAHRLEGLQPRVQRSGLTNVHTLVINGEHDARLQRMHQKADRVLVDAPCSGSGTLRRSPDVAWRQSPSAVADLQQLQLSILTSAAQLVKPGGRLVYATCSWLTDENEAVARAFAAAHSDFVPVPQTHDHSDPGMGEDMAHCHRLWPHRHHTDGFFAAIWQRKA